MDCIIICCVEIVYTTSFVRLLYIYDLKINYLHVPCSTNIIIIVYHFYKGYFRSSTSPIEFGRIIYILYVFPQGFRERKLGLCADEYLSRVGVIAFALFFLNNFSIT